MSEELRPPEGAEDTRWHWIEDRDGYRRPVAYMSGLWGIGDALVKPSTTGSLGYRYHAPARPDDATERARLEGEVARLREENDALSKKAEFDAGIFKVTAEKLADRWTKHRDCEQERRRMREALNEGRRAIGDHYAPNDCYATGPLTGDPHRDLVECPACSFIKMYEAVVPEALRHDR